MRNTDLRVGGWGGRSLERTKIFLEVNFLGAIFVFMTLSARNNEILTLLK